MELQHETNLTLRTMMATVTKHNMVLIAVTTLLMIETLLPTAQARTQYQFKQYTYRNKRDDRKFRVAKQHCEMSPECHGFGGLEQARCLMKCISQNCYEDLYGEDPLEEGEVDVRLKSFKGCLSQVPGADFS